MGLSALGAAIGLIAGAAIVGAAAAEDWLSPHYRDNPLVGKIWSVRAGAFVEPEAVFRAAQFADHVLLGETHTNGDHHRQQAAIIAAMVDGGRRPGIVFEMIPETLQEDLEAYLAGDKADAAGLGAVLEWTARGWPDWELYRPIAETLLANGLAIRAGDIGKTIQRQIATEGLGVLDAGTRKRLMVEAPMPEPFVTALIDELFESHCGFVPREALTGMLKVQRLRDAVMADALIEAGRDDGAVLIAGAGHIRRDRAVPWYLAARSAPGKVLVVAFREVNEGVETVQDYLPDDAGETVPYDFIWFTPRADLTDHCEELRERFSKDK